jgi:hypothetical protein
MAVRRAVFLLAALLLPALVSAATLRGGDSLTVSETLPGNLYLAGAQVELSAPVNGDLIAAGNAIHALAEVAGDALLVGGSIVIDAPVNGDLRALGGQIVAHEVGGELAGVAGLIRILEPAGEIRVAGASVEALGGAKGPVTIYGNQITLGGTFEESVRVVAADRVTLQPGTVIRGALEYNAPQEAVLPESASVASIRYIGTASFLPTPEEAQAFALAGFGVFFVVRALAGMLAAGLLAGLFPGFARALEREALESAIATLTSFVVGFLALFAAPILALLLVASVVGIGIAFVIGAGYFLALLLAYLYGALLLGSLASRLFRKKPSATWPAALLGMLILYLVGLVPVLGFLVAAIVVAVALGAMLRIFYRFAFRSEEL